MRNIALFLTYLGTDYHGWQVQKNLPTVAETMEKAGETTKIMADMVGILKRSQESIDATNIAINQAAREVQRFKDAASKKVPDSTI